MSGVSVITCIMFPDTWAKNKSQQNIPILSPTVSSLTFVLDSVSPLQGSSGAIIGTLLEGDISGFPLSYYITSAQLDI